VEWLQRAGRQRRRTESAPKRSGRRNGSDSEDGSKGEAALKLSPLDYGLVAAGKLRGCLT
jgi:hypothetical protein